MKTEWNLKLLYSSITDPNIEKDIVELETLCWEFNKKYSKGFIEDEKKLLASLHDYFFIDGKFTPKIILYLNFLLHKDPKNNKAQSLLNLMSNRITKSSNELAFYQIELGKIDTARQENILNSKIFENFRFFLRCVFSDADFNLSEAEEKIINFKKLPAYDMWIESHQRALSSLTVKWKGKVLALPQAQNLMPEMKVLDRVKLSKLVNIELKKIAFFSEAEINAIATDKKINDELRGYKAPYENTINNYRNESKTVETLVSAVTENFKLSNKFYKIKAKLFKLDKLHYCDRNAKYKKVSGDFSLENSVKLLSSTLSGLDEKYSKILQEFIKNGQIDVYPKPGKIGGAYCSSNFQNPTYVLLNHVDNINSYTTFAHEMGHAIHSELSRSQGPVYSSYSTSTAETASTFFEGLAFDDIFEKLSKEERVLALHDKINNEVSTIFRQIACFNLELDIHNTIRKNGFISAAAIAELHNKHMKAYLGPVFELDIDDGYFFVGWRHIRSFFYVYTYAFGLLVSKVLLKKYKENKVFAKKIEQFLLAGGKDSPENIFREIGIDVGSSDFFKEGLGEIEKEIELLEKLIKA